MPIRLAYLVTHPMTANLLLRGQLAFMRDHGFDVTVISSPGPELDAVRERDGVRTLAVQMSRRVRMTEGPAAALGVLAALRRTNPHIVNASTPKAGLLGMMASLILRVPARVYLLRGLRLEGFDGAARAALGAAERTASACAHRVVCVSESLRRAYVDGGYVRAGKTMVIPSNGVDTSRFPERARTRAVALDLRARLGIPSNAVVAGFVGRLAADKGLSDLLTAAEHAAVHVPSLHLLVVGKRDELPDDLAKRLATNPRVVLTGEVADPAPHYAAMDLLVFPSYREGLPNVPLEAAASELPAIGYRSTGVIDAISDGLTGRIVDRGDANALSDAMVEYAHSPGLRAAHGAAGRARVLAHFTNERVWEAWLKLYREHVNHKLD